jgi:hypothetical protein
LRPGGTALALALVLVGCATDGPPPAPAASTAEQLVSRLPASLGGFQRGGTTPLTEPSAGTESAYATANRAIAGYVQVLGRTDSVATEPELRRFVAEVASGSSRQMRTRAQAAIGDFRCAELDGTYGRQAVESLACAGAFGGQLVRLRLTMVRRGDRMAEARAFAEGIAAALR